MFMLVSVSMAAIGQKYYRPGGWYLTQNGVWMQRDNAYCGHPNFARCNCVR
jgi:hypothetical protein